MLVPFEVSETAPFYQNYYLEQVGTGLTVFKGRRVQKGYGIGGFFSGLLKRAMPILKTAGKAVGKQLLNTGAGVVRDLLDGENFGASAEKRFKGAASNLLDEASGSNDINPVPHPTMKRARRKVKRMKGSGLDIFA